MVESVQSRIDIEVRSAGAEKATASLERLADANDGVVVSLDRASKIRERNEAAVERLAKRYDAEYRALKQAEQAQKELERARMSGLAGTQAYERALAGLSKAHNDNAKASGLARHELINLSRQFQDVGVSLAGGQSPLTVLFQQGSQIADIFSSSRSGAAAALQSFGAIAVRALFSPITAAVSLVAAIGGVQIAALKANDALISLGDVSKRSGLSAESLQGAKIVGASSGLSAEDSVTAFANASKQFEQFARNEGAVKGALDKIDAGFLKVADKARNAGEFIDLVEQKIRSLPRAEGLNLAQSLFGEDAGARLFDAIESGAASMRGLAEAAGRGGDHLNQVALAALEAQRQIDEAAAIANDKLLKAFQDIGDPVNSIKLGWYEIVGAMADAVSKSEALTAILRGMAHPFDTLREAPARVAGALGLGPGVVPEFRGRFIPLDQSGIVQPETVGASRQRFIDRAEAAKAASRTPRISDAERSAERFGDITADLRNRIALASAEGVEHDKIALKIKVETEQRKLGKGATQEQKDAVSGLVTQLDEAERAQKRLTDAGKAYTEILDAVRGSAGSALGGLATDLMHGARAAEALTSALEKIADRLLSLAADRAIEGIFGKTGSAAGGSILSSIGSFFGFADGGIVGAPGARTMQAPVSAFIGARHYASGGAVPVIAHAGEVILNAAQQANVAAALAAGRRGGGNDNRGQMQAAPVTVNLIGAPGGAQVQDTTDSRGARRIDVVFKEAVAGANSSPQGAESLRNGYGIRQQVARR